MTTSEQKRTSTKDFYYAKLSSITGLLTAKNIIKDYYNVIDDDRAVDRMSNGTLALKERNRARRYIVGQADRTEDENMNTQETLNLRLEKKALEMVTTIRKELEAIEIISKQFEALYVNKMLMLVSFSIPHRGNSFIMDLKIACDNACKILQKQYGTDDNASNSRHIIRKHMTLIQNLISYFLGIRINNHMSIIDTKYHNVNAAIFARENQNLQNKQAFPEPIVRS